MGRRRKKGKTRRKPRHLLQCPVIGCGRKVKKLVADPRYPMQFSRLCCEKCAKRFEREERRRDENGQEEKEEIQGSSHLFNL